MRCAAAAVLAVATLATAAAVSRSAGPGEVEPVSPEHLEAALAVGRCDGPTVVFFGTGVAADAQEASALEEFGAAAKEFGGLACFKALSCGRWPEACADHNLRRVPAVVLFPPEGGAAQPYAGRLEKKELAAEVVKRVVAADRSTKLAGEAAAAWLRSGPRPVKVVLVSGKSSTPTILRALSGDRRLWPYADFGFAQENDKAILKYFQVSEVPFIVAQCGDDPLIREVYPGTDLSYSALHQWLVGLIFGEDAPFGKCLVDATLAAEAEEDENATVEDVQVPYERLDFGANGCPPGTEIKSVQECEEAIRILGYDVDPRWVSTFPGLPRGCSIREQTDSNNKEHMHFNSAPTGKGREDLAPICRVPEAAPEKDPAAASTPAQMPAPGPKTSSSPVLATKASQKPASKIAELSRTTYEELVDSKGFGLVYLRRGPISKKEVDMLLALKEEFEPGLLKRGTKLRWLWLDMQAERRIGRIFDPPTLPSALVLNPHKSPRYFLVTHDEKDGEALPIGSQGIIQLLNRVLSGNARFTAVPAQKLTAWADRSGGTSAAGEAPGKRTEAAATGAEGQNAPKGGRTALYEKMEYGAAGCPPGTEITSIQECELAIKSLGINTEPKWVSMYPGLPAGCSVREAVDSDNTERLHFNSASAGAARKDLAPVCRAPPPPAAGPPPPALPELVGRTHRELLGGGGLSLVYLREGPITREETRMLLALEERFQKQLEQAGLRLAWMWMDVRVERKLAGAFDAEALPSAVVLDPRKKPHFASMTHAENAGEVMPADEASIVMLVNTVISGDAEFKPMSAQKLAIWADGTTA